MRPWPESIDVLVFDVHELQSLGVGLTVAETYPGHQLVMFDPRHYEVTGMVYRGTKVYQLRPEYRRRQPL
jgi:hypothetical protein